MSTRPERAFTLLESLIAIGMFAGFCLVLFFVLQSTSNSWRRTSSRDDAVRQLLKARTSLSHDVANACYAPSQCARTSVGPSLGAGLDGDAFTILSCDNGTGAWNVTSNGNSILTSQITYALWVPQNVDGLYHATFTGVVDPSGYEQGCPYKWLVRRIDPPPAAIFPSTYPAIPTDWAPTLLSRPTSISPTPTQQVVAVLTGFRVLAAGSQWQFELKATAVDEASRQLGLGSSPLGTSSFAIVQHLTVPAHN